MYEIVIKDYINKLTEEKIIKYCKSKDIDISFEDAKILYVYAKNYWRLFYRDYPEELIKELKEKLSPNTFDKLLKIYKDIKKRKIN